jgi:hypothetical protein
MMVRGFFSDPLVVLGHPSRGSRRRQRTPLVVAKPQWCVAVTREDSGSSRVTYTSTLNSGRNCTETIDTADGDQIHFETPI